VGRRFDRTPPFVHIRDSLGERPMKLGALLFLSFATFFVAPRFAQARDAAPPQPKPVSRADLGLALDAALDALRKNELAGLASQTDLAKLRADLQALADRTDAALKAQDRKLEDKPWWQSPLFIGLLTFAGSGVLSWKISTRNNAKAEDLQARALDHARELKRAELARGHIDRFDHRKVSEAFGALEKPESLTQEALLNGVGALGDYYNNVASDWRSGAADGDMLAKANFRELFDNFRKALEAAVNTLDAAQAQNPLLQRPADHLRQLAGRWTSLWDIIGQQPGI
jgi:hypothetical protein